MIAKGNTSVTLEEVLSKMSEGDILSYYLGINNIPCIINSPLRKDLRPSFGLYSLDGKRIYYKDLSTKEKGGIFDLLGKMWGLSYLEVLEKVNNDIKLGKKSNIKSYTPCNIRTSNSYKNNSDLKVKVREWKDYDIEYWNSYGITLEWLKWADVFPISYKIIIKDGAKHTFKADKYAYAFVEHKEGNTTIKVYQPFNKVGYKWANKHDGSVISLWTKVPKTGDKICVCSSVKDALCLSCNLCIPAIAIQGEGYGISKTAIEELKRRFKEIFILLDNDKAGLYDGEKLAGETGFINLVLPQFEGGKDISDAFKILGRDRWVAMMLPLFYPSSNEYDFTDILPF